MVFFTKRSPFAFATNALDIGTERFYNAGGFIPCHTHARTQLSARKNLCVDGFGISRGADAAAFMGAVRADIITAAYKAQLFTVFQPCQYLRHMPREAV